MKKLIISLISGIIGMIMGCVILYCVTAPLSYSGFYGVAWLIPGYLAVLDFHTFLYMQLDMHLSVSGRDRWIGYSLFPVIVFIFGKLVSGNLATVSEHQLSSALTLVFLPTLLFSAGSTVYELVRLMRRRNTKEEQA